MDLHFAYVVWVNTDKIPMKFKIESPSDIEILRIRKSV